MGTKSDVQGPVPVETPEKRGHQGDFNVQVAIDPAIPRRSMTRMYFTGRNQAAGDP